MMFKIDFFYPIYVAVNDIERIVGDIFRMKFENEYYKDEVREGFYIPGMLKRSWATQLDVLEKVASVCEKHGIKWYADCGTLLGAIRHRGFIPWDDDLDICMMRDDYIRFNNVAKEELPSQYRILNMQKEKEYNNFLTRVINHDVIDTSKEFLENNHGFPYVSGIDILPLDYVYKDEKKENERCKRGKEIFDIAERLAEYRELFGESEVVYRVEKVSGYKVDRSIPLINGIHRILESIFKEADSQEAEDVALMRFWIVEHNHRYSRNLYQDYLNMPFENIEIRVPWAYEKVLQIEYGEWKIVNRKGGIHDYPFYFEQEKLLALNRGGKVPYKYYYKPVEKREDSIEVQILNLIKNANTLVGNLLNTNRLEGITHLLEKCQELAIALGNSFEANYRDRAKVAVTNLRNYCEVLYELNLSIQEGTAIVSANTDVMDELINEIENKYYELRSNGNIIFVIYKQEQWDKVEKLYFKRLEESNGNALVMVVPYYEKNCSNQNEILKMDTISLPKGARTSDYQTYDFKGNRPREIYFTDPFDEYSSAVGIHPFYYSSKLREMTDKLVYVSIIDADVPNDEDEKGWLTSKYYVITPGVVNADVVLVNSDELKRMYKKICMEFGERYEKIELYGIVSE